MAIYGMSYVGETLAAELRKTSISVAYGIDGRKKGIYADFPIYRMEDKLENVDAILVTAISSYESIKENLSKKLSCEILSIEKIIYEL